MKRIFGVITARMGSKRLSGKVMRRLCHKTVFEHHVERMLAVKGLTGVYLATSKDIHNNSLIKEPKRLGIKYYRGAEEDVLARHIAICQHENADAVIRVTCDMPLFDIESASRYVELFNREIHDYIYIKNMTLIQGTVPELISSSALKKAHKEYRGPAITQPIKERLGEYKCLGLDMPNDLVRPEYRLTLDVEEDFKVLGRIYDKLYTGVPIRLAEVYRFLDDYPEVAAINSKIEIKGCEVMSANLLERPLYSIVQSGDGYIILDGNKSPIAFKDFIDKLEGLFYSDRH